QERPVPIFETILAHDPELFLMIGDNIYADTHDIDLMRAKYARLGAVAGYQKLRQTCPVLATWDDHDYGVNDGGADYPQREASQQAFFDFFQVPADSPLRGRPGVYDARTFGPEGRRVQVIPLDTRYFRSPLKPGEKRLGGSWVPDDDPAKTMLGEAQWMWLEEQLKQPAEVRLLVSSIQCLPDAVGQETWSNLPHERQRLFRLIDSTGAEGIVILSGDRHWAELSRIDEGVPYPLYDLTSSSLNQLHPRGTPTQNSRRAIPETFHRENFGVVAIDWDQPDPTIRLEIRDLEDAVRLTKTLRLSELRP
ncbi:MAG: alkaline phosphatase family protein, partial [Planctomycetes bacterium]|nr:alkaline phosphatase family protein [Planctomycetota bacterium]